MKPPATEPHTAPPGQPARAPALERGGHLAADLEPTRDHKAGESRKWCKFRLHRKASVRLDALKILRGQTRSQLLEAAIDILYEQERAQRATRREAP